ncbi:hypothetical protein C4553_00270 [Candidatus Parcubacteria bacterium]|nr:MAG: hypothetical protein C4553_00270 [Candidatus Parcubacteria bacterium]
MKHIKSIIILVLLQVGLDVLFVKLYPSVNPIRATFIGISAFLVLWIFRRYNFVNPLVGFASIYSSALFGALLVQAGVLISKSFLSGIIHIAILVVTYIVIILFKKH